MQYKISKDGIDINVNTYGTGANAIIFMHGNSCSSENWSPQFTDEQLLDKYKLVTFDLPGHGKSAWAKGGTALYSLRNLSEWIHEIVKEVNLGKYIVAALSMGTNILLETDRPLAGCKGVMLASPCILGEEAGPQRVFTNTPVPPVNIMSFPSNDQLVQFAESLVFDNKTLVTKFIESYKNTDPVFRAGVGEVLLKGDWSDELKTLKNWKLPVYIVFGREERLIQTDYLDNFPNQWQDKPLLIEKAGHLVNEEQPEQFNEVLSAFADICFK